MSLFRSNPKKKSLLGFILLLPFSILMLIIGIMAMNEHIHVMNSPELSLKEFLLNRNNEDKAFISDYKIDFKNTISAPFSEFQPGNIQTFIPLRIPSQNQDDEILCFFRYDQGGPLTDLYADYLVHPKNDYMTLNQDILVRIEDDLNMGFNVREAIDEHGAKDAVLLVKQEEFNDFWTFLLIGFGMIVLWVFLLIRRLGKEK